MDAVLQSFMSGFPVLLSHFIVTVLLLIGGVVIYVAITPHHEMKLIREGNTAAAVSLAGIVVGLALPLAVSMAVSLSVFDILIWGVFALAVQLITFFVVDGLMRGLSKRIEAGEMAPAVVLVAAKLAIAMITAAALSG